MAALAGSQSWTHLTNNCIFIQLSYGCYRKMPQTSLDKLLQRPDIWQSARKRRQDTGVATGFTTLDKSLHLGGWPPASLIEILCQQQGIGELQLLLPTLVQLTRAGHPCLLLSPPHIPYPPALEAAGVDIDKLLVVESNDTLEQLWCAEQVLRSSASRCTIAWFGSQQLQTSQLRKLLLAAKHSHTPLFLYRSMTMAQHASPASLRLQVDSQRVGQLELCILKQAGGWAGQTLSLPRQEAWLNTSLWQTLPSPSTPGPVACPLQVPRPHASHSAARQ